MPFAAAWNRLHFCQKPDTMNAPESLLTDLPLFDNSFATLLVSWYGAAGLLLRIRGCLV